VAIKKQIEENVTIKLTGQLESGKILPHALVRCTGIAL
jgi:hypothetical protein